MVVRSVTAVTEVTDLVKGGFIGNRIGNRRAGIGNLIMAWLPMSGCQLPIRLPINMAVTCTVTAVTAVTPTCERV